MRESKIEKYLVDEVKAFGGLCWKFVSPGNSGVPDRVVLYKGMVCFIELKAPGNELRPLQEFRKKQIEQQGCSVKVIDSIDSVNSFIIDMVMTYGI